MRSIDTMMRNLPRYVLQFSWKPLWALIICLFIASCGAVQNPAPAQKAIVCGTVTNPGTEGTVSAEHVGECFWGAYQHCYVASLTYVNQNANTLVFKTEEYNSKCEVVETIRSAKGASTYTCSQLQAFRGGDGALIFSGCGDHRNTTIFMNSSIL